MISVLFYVLRLTLLFQASIQADDGTKEFQRRVLTNHLQGIGFNVSQKSRWFSIKTIEAKVPRNMLNPELESLGRNSQTFFSKDGSVLRMYPLLPVTATVPDGENYEDTFGSALRDDQKHVIRTLANLKAFKDKYTVTLVAKEDGVCGNIRIIGADLIPSILETFDEKDDGYAATLFRETALMTDGKTAILLGSNTNPSITPEEDKTYSVLRDAFETAFRGRISELLALPCGTLGFETVPKDRLVHLSDGTTTVCKELKTQSPVGYVKVFGFRRCFDLKGVDSQIPDYQPAHTWEANSPLGAFLDIAVKSITYTSEQLKGMGVSSVHRLIDQLYVSGELTSPEGAFVHVQWADTGADYVFKFKRRLYLSQFANPSDRFPAEILREFFELSEEQRAEHARFPSGKDFYLLEQQAADWEKSLKDGVTVTKGKKTTIVKGRAAAAQLLPALKSSLKSFELFLDGFEKAILENIPADPKNLQRIAVLTGIDTLWKRFRESHNCFVETVDPSPYVPSMDLIKASLKRVINANWEVTRLDKDASRISSLFLASQCFSEEYLAGKVVYSDEREKELNRLANEYAPAIVAKLREIEAQKPKLSEDELAREREFRLFEMRVILCLARDFIDIRNEHVATTKFIPPPGKKLRDISKDPLFAGITFPWKIKAEIDRFSPERFDAFCENWKTSLSHLSFYDSVVAGTASPSDLRAFAKDGLDGVSDEDIASAISIVNGSLAESYRRYMTFSTKYKPEETMEGCDVEVADPEAYAETDTVKEYRVRAKLSQFFADVSNVPKIQNHHFGQSDKSHCVFAMIHMMMSCARDRKTLSDSDIRELCIAALFHDCGKTCYENGIVGEPHHACISAMILRTLVREFPLTASRREREAHAASWERIIVMAQDHMILNYTTEPTPYALNVIDPEMIPSLSRLAICDKLGGMPAPGVKTPDVTKCLGASLRAEDIKPLDKGTKLNIIIVGLPGSGKTIFARELVRYIKSLSFGVSYRNGDEYSAKYRDGEPNEYFIHLMSDVFQDDAQITVTDCYGLSQHYAGCVREDAINLMIQVSPSDLAPAHPRSEIRKSEDSPASDKARLLGIRGLHKKGDKMSIPSNSFAFETLLSHAAIPTIVIGHTDPTDVEPLRRILLQI